MDNATIWLISSIIGAIALFIVWIVLRSLRSRKNKLTLFSGEGYFFRGAGYRLNPFLIFRKQGHELKLNPVEELSSGAEAVQISSNSKPFLVVSKGFRNPEKFAIQKKKEGREIMGRDKRKRAEKPKPGRKKSIRGIAIRKGTVLIRVNNIDGLISQLKEKNIEHILSYIRKDNYSIIENLFIGKTFDSEKEFMEYLKEEIVIFLNSEVFFLQDRISILRRKGADVSELSFKSMVIPLKIKFFEASFETKDFDRVIFLLNELEELVKQKEEFYKKPTF